MLKYISSLILVSVQFCISKCNVWSPHEIFFHPLFTIHNTIWTQRTANNRIMNISELNLVCTSADMQKILRMTSTMYYKHHLLSLYQFIRHPFCIILYITYKYWNDCLCISFGNSGAKSWSGFAFFIGYKIHYRTSSYCWWSK